MRSLRAPLVEIGILAALVYGVNVIFFPGDPGLAHLAPHPSLFITLLVIARYGMLAGTVAAILCAVEYLSLLAIMTSGSHVSLFAPPYSTPLVILVPATLIFGKLVDRHRKKTAALALAAHTAAEKAAEADKKATHLRHVNLQLGAKVVNAETTLPVLFGHWRALQSTDRAELGRAALLMLAEVANVEAASIWDVVSGRLRLRCQIGPQAVAPHFDHVASGLFDERDVLAINRVPEESRAGLPLLVGCVRAGLGGDVVSYIALDRMPLGSSHKADLLLGHLVEWLSLTEGKSLTSVRARSTSAPLFRAVQ